MSEVNWREEDLKKLRACLEEWDKNEEGMQDSYPRGLSQYLEESNYIYGSLCDLIAELHNNSVTK